MVVPTAAADVALKVATVVVAVETGLNETVMPVGRVDVAKVTFAVKPLLGLTVTVLLAVPPCATLSVGVDVETEKDAGRATVKAMATVEVRVPDFPVTVTLAVPAVALALAVKVKVLDVAVLAGLKEADTPLGRPEIVKATAPVNPFAGETLIAAVAVAL